MGDPIIIGEDLTKRKRDCRLFTTDQPNRFITEIGPGMNFWHKNDRWEDPSLLLSNVSDGIESNAKDFKYKIKDSGSFEFQVGTEKIEFVPIEIGLYDTNNGNSVKLYDVSNIVQLNSDVNKITWTGVFPGVDYESYIGEFGFKDYIKINQKPTMPSLVANGMNPNTTLFYIGYDTKGFKKDLKCKTSNDDFDIGKHTTETLTLKDNNNNDFIWFPESKAWNVDGTRKTPVVKFRTNSIGMGIGVPYTWFVKSRLPITIDPTTSIDVAAGAHDGHVVTTEGSIVDDSGVEMNSGYNVSDDGKGANYITTYVMFFKYSLSTIPSSVCNTAEWHHYSSWGDAANLRTFKLRLLSTGWGDTIGINSGSLTSTIIGSYTGGTSTGWVATSLYALGVQGHFGYSDPIYLKVEDSSGIPPGTQANYVQTVKTYENATNLHHLYIDYTVGSWNFLYAF